MVEEFSEFDESHLAVLSGHFHYLTPESLTEGKYGRLCEARRKSHRPQGSTVNKLPENGKNLQK